MNEIIPRIRWTLVVTIFYLIAQVVLLQSHLPRVSLWSTVFVGLSYLVPIAQAIRIARQSTGEVRRGWWLWGIALALTMISMFLGGATRHGDEKSIPSTLSFVLDIAGASLSFFVICLPLLSQRSRWALILDFSFAMAFCAVWDGLFLLPPIMRSPRHLLDATLVVRAVIFLFALLTARIAPSVALARLIRVIAVFTWFRFMAYFFLGQVVWGWLNRPTDPSWDWVRDLPPIGVAFAVAYSRSHPIRYLTIQTRLRHVRFPLLFTAILLGLAFWIGSLNLRFGLFAAVVALLFAGLRAVLLPALQHLAKTPTLRGFFRTTGPADEDEVTGLVHSRQFLHALEDLWAAMPQGTSFHVLCCDVDFYAETRQELGAAYANSCMMAVAAILEQAGIDHPAHLTRVGESTFALLLPCAGLDQTLDHAEFLCREVRDVALFGPQNRVLTVSIGIGSTTVSTQHGPARVFAEAYRALADAQRLGRNRVESRVLAEPVNDAATDLSPHLHFVG